VLVGPRSVEQQQNLVAPRAIEVELATNVEFHILFNICFALGLDILSHQRAKLAIENSFRVFLGVISYFHCSSVIFIFSWLWGTKYVVVRVRIYISELSCNHSSFHIYVFPFNITTTKIKITDETNPSETLKIYCIYRRIVDGNKIRR